MQTTQNGYDVIIKSCVSVASLLHIQSLHTNVHPFRNYVYCYNICFYITIVTVCTSYSLRCFDFLDIVMLTFSLSYCLD
jgi:hypothetical protein